MLLALFLLTQVGVSQKCYISNMINLDVLPSSPARLPVSSYNHIYMLLTLAKTQKYASTRGATYSVRRNSYIGGSYLFTTEMITDNVMLLFDWNSPQTYIVSPLRVSSDMLNFHFQIKKQMTR